MSVVTLMFVAMAPVAVAAGRADGDNLSGNIEVAGTGGTFSGRRTK